MMPPVEIALLQLKKGRQAEGVVPIDDDDYVFVNKVGKPIDKHLDEVWSRALKKAGLRHRPSYQLRHTFVTTCINKTLLLPFIARLIGHSTIDTIVRNYASVIDKAATNYEERLRASFSAPASGEAVPKATA